MPELDRSETILLGHAKETGQPVTLSYQERQLGTYMIGTPGTGKTTQLLNFAMQDVAHGDGLCVIDPQGKWVEEILVRIPKEREQDVIVINPAERERPIGLHLLECSDPDDPVMVDTVRDQVLYGIFQEIWGDLDEMPRLADVLRVTLRTLILCQSLPDHRLRPTLIEMPRLLRDEQYRSFLLVHLRRRYPRELGLVSWWKDYEKKGGYRQDEQTASTLNKVERFTQSATVTWAVGQNETTINFRQVMDERKIVLVDLGEGAAGREALALIGTLVISRIYMAAKSRVDLTKRGIQPRQFHLLVDEFQNFATEAFARLQNECRQYGVDITIAHQNRLGDLAGKTQVQASTLGMANWIIFRASSKDAEALAPGFTTSPPEPELTGERVPLGFASYPWDELKRQSHESTEVTALVHEIDRWLTIRQPYDLFSWPMLRRELQLEGLTKEFCPDAKVSYIMRVYCAEKEGEKAREEEAFLQVYSFGNEHEREAFEKKLNSYLGMMMRGEGRETAESLLQALGESLFRGEFVLTLDHGADRLGGHSDSRYESFREPKWQEIEKRIPQFDEPPLAPDRGKAALAVLAWRIRTAVEEYRLYRTGAQRPRHGDDVTKRKYQIEMQLKRWQSIYARVAMRADLVEKLASLGQLLQQYPIWVRGGQPVQEYERPRLHADVVQERINQIARLPKYEALSRIDSGQGFCENHVLALNAYSLWQERADDPTESIKERSRQKYGRDRAFVERAIALRDTVGEGGKGTGPEISIPSMWDE